MNTERSPDLSKQWDKLDYWCSKNPLKEPPARKSVMVVFGVLFLISGFMMALTYGAQDPALNTNMQSVLPPIQNAVDFLGTFAAHQHAGATHMLTESSLFVLLNLFSAMMLFVGFALRKHSHDREKYLSAYKLWIDEINCHLTKFSLQELKVLSKQQMSFQAEMLILDTIIKRRRL